MTREELSRTLDVVFQECRMLRDAGQKEYARQEENAFGNFERIAAWLDGMTINRETVVLVYALKHLDGILSYLNGHRSQREDVRGRVNDLIVYLGILRGMIDETEGYGHTFDDALDDDDFDYDELIPLEIPR